MTESSALGPGMGDVTGRLCGTIGVTVVHHLTGAIVSGAKAMSNVFTYQLTCRQYDQTGVSGGTRRLTGDSYR